MKQELNHSDSFHLSTMLFGYSYTSKLSVANFVVYRISNSDLLFILFYSAKRPFNCISLISNF